MAKLLRNNGAILGPQITLFPGNRLSFKVSGLGPNKKHLILKSTDSALNVVALRVNDRNIEQSLRLDVQEHSIVGRRVAHVEAHLSDAQGRPQQKGGNTPRLTVEILPRLELPDENTEAGILARMLIVENAGPQGPRFPGHEEVMESMQRMVHVMRNRLRLGPQHFSARGATDLTAMIKGGGQVEGFENYPKIAPRPLIRLQEALDVANDGSHPKQKDLRIHVEHAISVAKGENIGIDPCPTGLYAWRTANSKSPGINFRVFQTKGGQDFYTLTDSFLGSVKGKSTAAR